MKNLYALLVGINEYPGCPLNQCLTDVKKMEQYCLSLTPHFNKVELLLLLDQQASKEAICRELSHLLSKLTDEDSLIFYFSGHGAQEAAGGRFKAEQDDLLECLVCCPSEGATLSENMLADKELRYLLTQCPTNPHILTVFDCCHSGDMVRSTPKKQVKRMSNIFPKRAYEGFIFNQELSEQKLKKEGFTTNFSFKNSINISACQSNQFSWEDSQGGVFTRYLLKLLTQTKNLLNYQFLVQWAKLNIRDQTIEKQVPTISVQGAGKLTSRTNWLGIFDQSLYNGGQLVYHEKNGWQLTLGKLMGIQKGTLIKVEIGKNAVVSGTVQKVGLDYAKVNLSPTALAKLTDSKVYPVQLTTATQPLKIHLYDVDKNASNKRRIQDMLKAMKGLQLGSQQNCDFCVVLFNQQLYFSLPSQLFQPLNRQLSMTLSDDLLNNNLSKDIQTLQQWHFFNTLYNPNQLRQAAPIKVELIPEGMKEGLDITDSIATLKANSNRWEGLWYADFQIKLTNTSQQDLFIVALSLGSDLSISAAPLDSQSILLPAGKSKYFYDHSGYGKVARCTFDTYKEVYNWKKEWFHYKFIINSEEDISGSIPSFEQAGCLPPLPFGNRGAKGVTGKPRTHEKEAYWAVYTSTIELLNPSYDEVSGTLLDQWEIYKQEIGEYLEKCYPVPALEVGDLL